MAFTDHKISAFAHKISDLADQPNLPPDELKARFDACPEELRQAVNAICDDADRLDERVTGIVAGTFGDTITEDMLSEELQAELGAKADQTAVTQQISLETAARESADTALDTRLTSLETSLPEKCEILLQTYSGNSQADQSIRFEYTPKAVVISCRNAGFGALLVRQGSPAYVGSTKEAELISYGSYSGLWLYDQMTKGSGCMLIFK